MKTALFVVATAGLILFGAWAAMVRNWDQRFKNANYAWE